MLANKIPNIIELSEPATDAEIKVLSSKMNFKMPNDYTQLLKESNGVLADLVQLYAIQDIPERNETYEISEYAPGYLLIGSVNSSPVLIKEETDSAVFTNDWGSMAPEEMIQIGTSLSTWISLGCIDSV